jgi:hypothetical protein
MLLIHLALIDGECGHSVLLRRSMLMRTDVQDLMDTFARARRTTTVGPLGNRRDNHRDLPKFNGKYIMRCGFLHQHSQMAQAADRISSLREEYGRERQNLFGIRDRHQRECRGRAAGRAQKPEITAPLTGDTGLSGRSPGRAATYPIHRGRRGPDRETGPLLAGGHEI